MDKLTFKNYPARIAILIICVIIALDFLINALVPKITGKEDNSFTWQAISIATSTGLVWLIMNLINKHAMWKWYLKLLGHCDIRGMYTGKIISSYHEQDNPAFPHIELYLRVSITQNLNGFHIDGSFYTDRLFKEKSSEFTSSDEVIKKRKNGHFQVHYFYNNKGSLLHADHQQYGLTNHTGICVLLFNPATRELSGYYFNHERSSHGTILLHPVTDTGL